MKKISLFGYFTGNEKNQTDALFLLDDCDTDEEKRSKRSFDEMQVDRTALICDNLIQPFDTIPNNANDLEPLVSAQLVRKLPVSFSKRENFLSLLDISKQVMMNVEVT
ncbi:hypothetical protein RclHR1_02950003 [Rhizophagus clarus]|uniref:Uncharacterized protein n=1 Tax=Rhizophagus clarus TaxID=94130 RepID=A0A2Z6RGT4_9GLOM|nr:hypothetical protein RclHR1_02950003 [Rhizophagus clarus]